MRQVGHGEKMIRRSYRVSIVAVDDKPRPEETFDTIGAEVCEDGSIYLPMAIGAKSVSADEWQSMTIEKVNE